MSKTPTDARREVTSKDLENVDAAIDSHVALGTFLYRSRYILGETSKLEQHYHNTKSSIVVAEQQCAQVNAELEAVKTRLATVQHEEVATRQRLATLTAEVAEKEQMLTRYSQTIDRITGKAA
jgi:septal ring factor EnvC (AmiA/AmiB activator)